MDAESFCVEDGTWTEWGSLAAPLRREVFVHEQRVPESLEWDGLDPECHHVIALDAQGRAIATARLTPDDHLGRMAVARRWRHRGVGRAVMVRAERVARRRGSRVLVLAAQLSALPFYEKLGYSAYGDVFEDAGIPHRMMCRDLAE